MINYQLNQKLIDDVEAFVEKNLSQKSTINELFDIINRTEQFEKFNELIFTAKYVNGLFRSIKSGQTNSQITNLEQIKSDFSENLKKVISILEEIVSKDSSELSEKIRSNYTKPSTEQFSSLMLLIEDLDQIKKYVNYLKRKS
jgi:hypothetical protein